MGLVVRVPAASLFHDEKFAFFYFGVRGTPKNLKIFLGVPPKNLKKVGVLLDAAKGFCPRRRSKRHSRSEPRAKPLRGDRQNPHFFQNLGGTPKKNFKILGVP